MDFFEIFEKVGRFFVSEAENAAMSGICHKEIR